MPDPTLPAEKPPMPVVDSTLKTEHVPTHRIKPLYRVTQVIWYVLGVVETFLLLRFLLKLFAANPQAGFTRFIYGAADLVLAPFTVVFRSWNVEGSSFEWSTLLAMLVYALLAWLIVKGIVMARPVTTEEAEARLPEQEKV